MKSLRLVGFVMAVICLLVNLFLYSSVQAAPSEQPVIKLKFGGVWNTNNPNAMADLAWIDKIQKDTKGRVQIEYFPAATLVSSGEHYAELVQGVCDISYALVAYSKAGFEMHRRYMPFSYGITNDETRRRIYIEILQKFPPVAAEWNKTKMLGITPGSNFQLFSTKPVRTLTDLRGMQIRATGSYVDLLKMLGGEGVTLPAPDTYPSLEKGIVQGTLAPWESFKSLRYAEVTKYATVLNLTATPYAMRAMNLNSWNKLPPDIQSIFDASIRFYEQEGDKQIQAADKGGLEFAKQQGAEVINLSSEELKKLYSTMETICRQVAADLDKKGYPGTAMFEEIRRLADKYK